MRKSFIVRTESAKPNSLKESVKIALTITPVPPGKPGHPYSPIAQCVTNFAVNNASTVTVPWSSEVLFAKYYIYEGQVRIAGPAVRLPSPGHALTLNSPSSTWSKPTSCKEGNSFVANNRSGRVENVMLYVEYPSLAYDPLNDSCSIFTPSNFELQAYIVGDGVSGLTILQPEHLNRPVFTSPILWDELPASSTWTLCQDSPGTFRIKNSDYPGLGYAPKRVAEPIGQKDLLSKVLERLTTIEQSINRMQGDINEGKRTVVELRDQFSSAMKEVRESREVTSGRLSDFNRSIVAVEARATTLAGSFDSSQDRLSVVHKAVSDTQRLLAGVERTTTDLRSRLPVVESKAENAAASLARSHDRLSTLEESTERTQNHVAAVEKAIHQTQDHVSVVQQLVVASNAQLSMIKQTSGITGVPDPVSPSEQLVDQGGRNPAVEARVERLERSVQDQRKAIRAIDRRLPKLETDMGTIQGSMTSLDHRVSAVEDRLEEDDVGVKVGHGPPSPVQGSPILFPRHLSEGPPAT